jgi:2-polyprenyl-3-methyl-5-hydroxy-6-metoxy-1,4-benzoquinol methylase
VKWLLRKLGRRSAPAYRYQEGDTVVEDFAQFSELPVKTVAQRIADFERINAADWNSMKKRGFSERAAEFYGASQNFAFAILSANPRPAAVLQKLDLFNPRIMEAIRAHPGRRFLEFGGGIGVFCEIMARMGKEIHYLELEGLTSRFALWRFRKLGLSVNFIEAKPDLIEVPGEYDIVYTDAVLEHLPPPLQNEAASALGRAVGPGGLLVFLVDLSGPTPEDPMHHEVDIRKLHELLTASGLSCQDGLHRFCSIWRRQ